MDKIQDCEGIAEGHEVLIQTNKKEATVSANKLQSNITSLSHSLSSSTSPGTITSNIQPNRPTSTPIPSLVTSTRLIVPLTTKTANVKSLTKNLENICFESDNPQSILATYARISNAVDIACDTNSLLPNVRNKNTSPDFYVLLVPTDTTHHNFLHAHNNFLSLSNCLFTFFQAPNIATVKSPDRKRSY